MLGIASVLWDKYVGDVVIKEMCFVCHRYIPRGQTITVEGERVCNIPSETAARRAQVRLDSPTYRRKIGTPR